MIGIISSLKKDLWSWARLHFILALYGIYVIRKRRSNEVNGIIPANRSSQNKRCSATNSSTQLGFVYF